MIILKNAENNFKTAKRDVITGQNDLNDVITTENKVRVMVSDVKIPDLILISLLLTSCFYVIDIGLYCQISLRSYASH